MVGPSSTGLPIAHAGWSGEGQFTPVQRNAERRCTILFTPARRQHEDSVRTEYSDRTEGSRLWRGWGSETLVIAISNRR